MRQILAMVLAFGLWGAHAAVAQGLSAAARAQMMAADVVILGEIHDNGAHHLGQATLMAELAPRAVVFEMLSAEMAGQVNAFDGGDVSTLGALIGWEAAGWPDFALYQPVFEALGNAHVVGAAVPRADVRAAFTDGAAKVFGPEAARFGLTADLPEAQRAARSEFQFQAHCAAMPMEMMGGMVEAQRLRDAAFAARALEAFEAHGAPVVVITGNGHARRDWGVPYLIGRAAPAVSVFSVGFVEAPATADDPRFDVTIVTAAAERGDPCAAFEK